MCRFVLFIIRMALPDFFKPFVMLPRWVVLVGDWNTVLDSIIHRGELDGFLTTRYKILPSVCRKIQSL